MEKEKKNYNLWNDYLTVGVIVAILLTMLDYSRDNFYLSIPVAIFFLFAGFKDNIQAIISFLLRYWFLAVVTIVYVGFYWRINPSMDSVKFMLAMFSVILGGFLFARRMGKKQEQSYKKLWVILIAVIVLGIFRMLVNGQVGYFMNYTVELAVVLIVGVITFLYFGSPWIWGAGGVVCLCSMAVILVRNVPDITNLIAIKGIIPYFFDSTVIEKFLGHGQLAAHYSVEDFSENTFVTLLYDYGAVVFIMYAAAMLFAVVLTIKSKDKILKKQAILVIVMLVFSVAFSMQYWSNIFFLIWTSIGAMLGRHSYIKDRDKDKD